MDDLLIKEEKKAQNQEEKFGEIGLDCDEDSEIFVQGKDAEKEEGKIGSSS